ncbi:hypothetical protein [Streptomyces sp. NPDC018584]|uniref:hypothetical protein n=1 Tax=unclassified Streptomyces TaxID=2593676 RepID=UPI0037B39155
MKPQTVLQGGIRYGKDGICRVRPPGGLVAARFRHYEARSDRPLLHDDLLSSEEQRLLLGLDFLRVSEVLPLRT